MGKWLNSTETIRFEVRDRVARITMNRPEKRNALSNDLLTELHQALMEADDLREVRCVVLAGEGKDFCAGYDLSPNANPAEGYDPADYRQGAANVADDIWRLERNQADILTIFDLHKPEIGRAHV